MFKKFIIYILFIGLNACVSNGEKQTEPSAIRGSLTVTKIVDGDTFWLIDENSNKVKIRLIGVDAPESRNAFKKKIGHYGKESKKFLSDLISDKKVRLEFDIDSTDQYKRTLAYAYLEDGTFVNAELVKNGYAMVMTIPPNVKFAEL